MDLLNNIAVIVFFPPNMFNVILFLDPHSSIFLFSIV